MKRLVAALQCDLRLQYRNGFYYAVAFVAIVASLLLGQLPDRYLKWLFPILLFSNLQVGTFYFVAGQVLLEKRENSLEAVVVTPLRHHEYLISKLATLVALALAENLIIVFLAYGRVQAPGLLIGGLVLGGLIYTLCGFIAVARYDSINEYLFPSVLFLTALSIPLLIYFEIPGAFLLHLHPLNSSLLLLQGAFEPISGPEIALALGSGAIWTGLLMVAATRAFSRFILRSEGAR